VVTLDELKQKAQTFVDLVQAGDFTAACRMYDAKMAQALPELKLKEAWDQLAAMVGPFQKVLSFKADEKAEYSIVTLTCQFDRSPVDLRLVFNQAGQLAGLTQQMAPSAIPYTPPAYVHLDAFHDYEVTVGSGDWALPATLSLPAPDQKTAGTEGSGPFPAVVLVHGSGPQDRDETIGPNRPFRDIAWGLASQGIAVLRYDKRTKAHAARYTPEMITAITVQDEVIDDALAAVRLLRLVPQVDPARIYVLGHSLGATLAPRIGQQDPAIAGLIIMGGITRSLEDTILDQYTYLYNLSGAITDAQKAELEELKKKVARVKDPNLSAATPDKDLPLGITPAYWFSLRGYHPEAVAAALSMRIFVLQGGRDYQVTTAGDYPAWQQALGGKPNATLKLYPRLFHLFMPGDGPTTPQEYNVENHVSEEVVADVARWVLE